MSGFDASTVERLARLVAENHMVNVEWNPHRANYETIEDHLECMQVEADSSTWETLVLVQVYPSTPVGFELYAGATLAEALEAGPRR